MTAELCLMVCENFRLEAAAALEGEGTGGVAVACFPASCGPKSVGWDGIGASLREQGAECAEVHLFGGCCLAGLGDPPSGFETVRLHRLESCFCLVLNGSLAAEYIKDRLHLLTPGWVVRWKEYVREWGLTRDTAREFFGESTSGLVLLDTGVHPGAIAYLEEFAEFAALPFRVVSVGLDHLRLRFSAIVQRFRDSRALEEARAAARIAEARAADCTAMLDLFHELSLHVLTGKEQKVVEDILETFRTLFAPRTLVYFPCLKGEEGMSHALGGVLPGYDLEKNRLLETGRDHAWIEGGEGFLLRIGSRENPSGVLVVDGFAFPQYRENYLNLALTAARACELAIGAVRAYGRLKEAMQQLREHRDHLGEVVRRRTEALTAANARLTREMELRRKTEKSLGESEELYRLLFENSMDAIQITAPDGAIFAANPAACRLLDRTEEEIVRAGRDGVVDLSDPRLPVLLKDRDRTGTFRGELTLVRKDGTKFEAEISSCVFRDRHGFEKTSMIFRDITERKRAEEDLRRSRAELRSLAWYQESAREEERRRIAREIHDELGQSLTALKMELAWLRNRLAKDLPALEGKIRNVIEIVDAMSRSVQSICEKLRPGILDHLGLAAAFEWYVGEFRKRTGIRCEAAVPEDVSVDPERATALFRVLQEALTNVARHAGAAKVDIRLGREGGMLMLSVRDDGKGITQEQIRSPNSFGLLGMRERVRHFGGDVVIMGEEGKGTTLAVSIPVERASGGGGAQV